MKKVFLVAITIVFFTSVATANPLEWGVKKSMEMNKASVVFGATAVTVDPAVNPGKMKIQVFEKGASSGSALLQTSVSVDNFDWNSLFDNLKNINLKVGVVVSDTPIGGFSNPPSLYGLYQGMKETLSMASAKGKGYYTGVGPDLKKQYPSFEINTYEKGASSGAVLLQKVESFGIFDWNQFFSKRKDKWVYVGMELFSATIPTPTPPTPKPAPATPVNPDWYSGSNDNSWDAKYDWSQVPDGVFAVEVVKTSTGGVKEWKLVKRVAGKIMPQFEVKITTTPSGSQDLKDQFQKNSTISKGDFVLLGNFSDKDIWVYQK